MLSVIYWEDEFPTRYQLGLNTATLIGSMIGQIVFGMLADRYGRRKMYGLELIITITASLGFATASTGLNSSMSLIGLLIWWRLVMPRCFLLLDWSSMVCYQSQTPPNDPVVI